MPSIRFVIYVCFLQTLFATSSQANGALVVLAIGEQTSVKISRGARFSVGNKAVLSVRATTLREGEYALLIKAKAQGYSDILVFEQNRKQRLKFRVVTKRAQGKTAHIQDLLKNPSSVRVMPNGSQQIIVGENLQADDFTTLQKISASSKNKVTSRLSISAKARDELQRKIRWNLVLANLPHIAVEAIGSQIWLTGDANSQKEKQKALAIAREIFPSVEDQIESPFDQQKKLSIRLRILEVMKQGTHDIGMKWNNFIPGLIDIQKQLTKANYSFTAGLNFLMRNGYVRVLSEPEVRLNTKGKSNLSVGGEIPIVTKTRRSRSVTWKKFGMQFDVEALGEANKVFRLKIKVGVSSLDFSQALDGLPAIKFNQLDTIVDLQDGQSIFLSGLMQKNRSESVDKVPLLADIPLLGKLFQSKEFREYKSELVIALTVEQEK